LIFEKTETLNWLYWLLSTGVITGLFLSFGSRSLLDYWPIGALGIGALAFAALPNLWAYSGFHAIADLFLTLLTIMVLAVAFTFHAILSGIQWLLRSRMTRASWRFPVGGSG
jgi:hypothetical protein